MAGRDSESSKGKAKEDIDVPIFSVENMQSNMKIIYYSRTFMSIIGGVIAGILGFTGVSGFIFYFVTMAITSVCLVAKTGFSINSYFSSWNQVVLDGFLGGLMSFVLFWTYLPMISCIFSERGSFSSHDEVAGVKPAITASTLILVFSFIEAALAAYYSNKWPVLSL